MRDPARAPGIEVVPHLTPRDSTIAGLESLLLGAHAEGVRNVLAVTGDPPEAGDYPGAGAVYDVDAIGLVELMARLNDGDDFHGRAIDAPTSFFPGVAVNPTADDLELEAERFAAQGRGRRAVRDDAGAVRPRRTSRRSSSGSAARRSRCSSACGRSGRSSSRCACTTRRRASSSRTTCRSATATPAPDAAGVGAELARELIAGARALAAGVYVVAPFRRPLGVLDVLAERSRHAGTGRDRPVRRARASRRTGAAGMP